tara:strand:- start:435 stop:644 length:210 start_codon:yes stop_codon:yes gene_type:complete
MLRNDLKEQYRLFYMVKGHLNSSPETVIASADGYFRRLWIAGSNGAPLYEYCEAFEKAWEERQKTLDKS